MSEQDAKNKHESRPRPVSSMLSSAHDLDVPLTQKDMELVEDFEAKWLEFMQAHPELMPSGGRSKKVVQLTAQVHKEKQAQASVEHELQEQLKLFGKTRDLLETNYNKAMRETVARQEKVQAVLNQEIDHVVQANELESKQIPWQHFLTSVDKATLVPTMELQNRQMKPSQRSMALVDHAGDASDVQLRAYRIDHALLTAQVEMLQQEVTRVEKTTRALDLVGEFLTENNIWSLLSKTH